MTHTVPAHLRTLHGQLRDGRIQRAFWRAVTRRAEDESLPPDHLEPFEVARIFGVAADHRTINQDERHDLELILNHAGLDHAAEARLRGLMEHWASTLPNLSPPLTGRARERVADVLENEDNVGRIVFSSPGTRMFYQPTMYHAVARLIRRGRIAVHTFYCGSGAEAEALGERTGGRWRSGQNEMFVPESEAGFGAVRCRTIVHEATHILQDFSNYYLRQDQYEADAYIAGAVSYYRGTRRSPDPYHAIYEAAFEAARQVQQQQAVVGPAYESVRQAVCVSYSGAASTHRHFGTVDSTDSEREFRDLIHQTEAAELRQAR
jgi:hypothetical protein